WPWDDTGWKPIECAPREPCRGEGWLRNAGGVGRFLLLLMKSHTANTTAPRPTTPPTTIPAIAPPDKALFLPLLPFGSLLSVGRGGRDGMLGNSIPTQRSSALA